MAFVLPGLIFYGGRAYVTNVLSGQGIGHKIFLSWLIEYLCVAFFIECLPSFKFGNSISLRNSERERLMICENSNFFGAI